MDLHNLAAWSEEPKGDLQIKEAPIPVLGDDEILIEVLYQSTTLSKNSTWWPR
jgi:NADPH:quinone reductase-like Zn-dependent oxidoreductase